MTPGDWVVSVPRVLSSCGWSNAVNARSQQQEVESHFQAGLTQMPLQVAFPGRCLRTHLPSGEQKTELEPQSCTHHFASDVLQMCHSGFSDRDVFC